MKSYSKLVLSAMAVAVLGLFSPALRAQDDTTVKPKVPRVKGTIEKIDDKSITIKTDKAKSSTFAIDSKTQLGTKAEPKKVSEFKVGDTVVVAADRDAKGNAVATAIFIPKAKPAEAPKKAPEEPKK